MNISKISINPTASFKAQTKITAPETLLSKKDREYFEKLGSKVGTDADTIEIAIGDLTQSKINPSVTVYNYSSKTQIGNKFCQKVMDIPYIKDGIKNEQNSPFSYLTKVFDRMINN